MLCNGGRIFGGEVRKQRCVLLSSANVEPGETQQTYEDDGNAGDGNSARLTVLILPNCR